MTKRQTDREAHAEKARRNRENEDGTSKAKVPEKDHVPEVPSGQHVVCMCKTRKLLDENPSRLSYDAEWASYPLELRTRLLTANKNYLDEMAAACSAMKVPQDEWPRVFARAGYTQVDTRGTAIQKDGSYNGFTVYMADCHKAIKMAIAKNVKSESEHSDAFSDIEAPVDLPFNKDKAKEDDIDPDLVEFYRERTESVGFGMGGANSKHGPASGASAENILIAEAWRNMPAEKKALYEKRAAERNAKRPDDDSPSTPETRALWALRFKRAMNKWVCFFKSYTPSEVS
ncbi:hypothetical protein BJ508DRAFT_337015 [Ascobolus immersus RN42]|uniref:Uncharacterized protein n=1 Tax=Ascobolus immersus RN42 TaxID=1160509 RepID=A0A3N4H6M1_ASCIM|nr:hypothetical protein BJ508DRAFT_337015 [Ascobolus immersus RN42]